MSSSPSSRIAGLYLITRESADTAALLRVVGAAISGGARLIQYRDKSGDPQRRMQQAQALRALCRVHGRLLIVNDDVVLAAAVDADGVHLGADDGSVAAARAVLGPERIIGVSCYNRPELAMAAAGAGADYVAFGAFFSSATKPGAVTAAPQLLREARSLGVPLVAIGGISADNGRVLVQAGADALAVLAAVWDAEDSAAESARISLLFNEQDQ
jgi:thiamine-phosphate pyrophosphorylase